MRRERTSIEGVTFPTAVSKIDNPPSPIFFSAKDKAS